MGLGLDMPLREAMETQRAIRRLKADPVDDDVVLACIELALKAPTGGNSQSWEFVVVRDRDTMAALSRQYRRAWAVYGGIGKLVYRRDDHMQRVLRAVEWQVDHFHEVPVLVVCCQRGQRIPFVPLPPIIPSSYYGSLYPAVQNLLLAARAQGLGAALVTLPLWSTTVARRLLGLPLSVMPACAVPMGWPRGKYGPTTRKPVGDVVHLDRYGHRPWRDAIPS